jgi:hypothetical protein
MQRHKRLFLALFLFCPVFPFLSTAGKRALLNQILKLLFTGKPANSSLSITAVHSAS